MTSAATIEAPPDGLEKVPYLVVNPRSAGGATGRKWARLEAEARSVLGDLRVGMTGRPLEAIELTRAALVAGHRLILAVGGDGTLNEVTNGFFHPDGRLVAPGASLGLLPQGTGGDFRKSVAIPDRWGEALRHVAAAKPRPIDVGRITFRAHDGSTGVRHFINVASLGISGDVANRVNGSSKALGGRLSFTIESAMALANWKDVRVRLRIDGGEPREHAITCLALANGRFFGGGMMVAPEAKVDDGLLHGTIWSGYGLGTFLFRQPGIFSGAHVGWAGTSTFTARRVEVDGDQRVLIDVDGEQPGMLPVTIEVVPSAIHFSA